MKQTNVSINENKGIEFQSKVENLPSSLSSESLTNIGIQGKKTQTNPNWQKVIATANLMFVKLRLQSLSERPCIERSIAWHLEGFRVEEDIERKIIWISARYTDLMKLKNKTFYNAFTRVFKQALPDYTFEFFKELEWPNQKSKK